MGLMDRIKKMTGGAEDPYNDRYDEDYYNEFEDAYNDQSIPDGAEQDGSGNLNLGGVSLSGSSIEIKIIRPTHFKNGAQIANHLLNKRTVVLNLENTDKETARRLIDFLCGVSYSIGGDLKAIAGNAYVITPDNVEISRDRVIERKKDPQSQDEEDFSDI